MAEDDKKKRGGGGDDDGQGENAAEVEQRDPDEMVFAEQAIHHYVSDVIARFVDEASNAFSMVAAHLGGLEQLPMLNGVGTLATLGTEMVEEMLEFFGGKDAPIAQAVAGDLLGTADQCARGGSALDLVNDMGYALRDAGWYVRDNLQSILSGEWDELRDLAYEGETLFIPLLHSLGLPAVELTSRDIADEMIDEIDDLVEGIPKEMEAKVEESPAVAEAKPEEMEPIAQTVLEEEKKDELLA